MATKAANEWYWGTGRRKSAVARVRLREGEGNLTINGRPVEDYFSEDRDRGLVFGPLELTEMKNRLDVHITIRGGGYAGQAGAACQGIARALKDMFSETEEEQPQPAPTPVAVTEGAEGEEGAEGAEGEETTEEPVVVSMVKKLRDSGYLTRDGRMKERKKYGQKGARKSFQFSKR